MVGTGAAARHGILIRDPAAMEQARAIRTVVFDKTGTLTEGRPSCWPCNPAPECDETDVLRLAAAIQAGSEHPLGPRRADPGRPGISVPATAGVRALAGRGVEGTVEGTSSCCWAMPG